MIGAKGQQPFRPFSCVSAQAFVAGSLPVCLWLMWLPHGREPAFPSFPFPFQPHFSQLFAIGLAAACCRTAPLALPYSPYCIALRPVSRCVIGRFYAPGGLPLSGGRAMFAGCRAVGASRFASVSSAVSAIVSFTHYYIYTLLYMRRRLMPVLTCQRAALLRRQPGRLPPGFPAR